MQGSQDWNWAKGKAFIKSKTYRCNLMPLRQLLGLNTCPRQSLRWLKNLSIPSVTGEAVVWRTRPLPLQLLAQVDTFPRPPLTHQLNKTSQGGPCLRVVVPAVNWDVLTRIRPMILDLPSVCSHTLRISRLREPTLAQQAVCTLRNRELSRTWCRVDPRWNSITLSSELRRNPFNRPYPTIGFKLFIQTFRMTFSYFK